MTDAAIADTLNQEVAKLVAAHLDFIDMTMIPAEIRWPYSSMADTLMADTVATLGDRAWLVGMLAARTPGVNFDGWPADADWDNLFSHFRAEILARRDPQTPSVREASSVRDGVGS